MNGIETLRQLHAQNRDAIASLQAHFERLEEANERTHAQLQLILKMMMGGNPADPEVIIKFREEHERFKSYDRTLREAVHQLGSWAIRMLLIGSLFLVVWGVAAVGILDFFKAFFKTP